jgi:hypothetical protein
VIPTHLASTVASLHRQATTVRSVQLKASAAIVEIDQRADLSVSAEAGDPAYAVEDCQQIFRLLEPHFAPIIL